LRRQRKTFKFTFLHFSEELSIDNSKLLIRNIDNKKWRNNRRNYL
jgi:hypothetical protein